MRTPTWLPLVLLVALGCGPASIGPERESFRAVDALFTAVSIQDAAQLEMCARRLDELKEGGKLPEPAHTSLSIIVQQARDGDWDTARRDLRRFMKGQRAG